MYIGKRKEMKCQVVKLSLSLECGSCYPRQSVVKVFIVLSVYEHIYLESF